LPPDRSPDSSRQVAGARRPPRRPGQLRIGMALYGDLTYDSRVQREARALAEAGYSVSLMCLSGTTGSGDLHPDVHVTLERPTATKTLPGGVPAGSSGGIRSIGPLRRIEWLAAYIRNLRQWGRLVVAAVGPVDGWHLHDLPSLVAILPLVGDSVPVVYDSHEIFIESGTAHMLPSPIRSLLRAYEKRLVSRVAAMVTVNDSLANVLGKRYRPRRLVVVHNCTDRWDPAASATDKLRAAAGIPPSTPVILYLGGLGPARGIEQLALSLLEPGLEAAHLVLLGPSEHSARYQSLAEDPRWRERVHILEPVAPADLPLWVHSADVGGILIQATTLNHRLSTPNKLFECLAAGVPVVVSDFPSMRRIVTADPSGWLGAVCDPADVHAVATALRSILDLDVADRSALRDRCLAAAHHRWNWATEAEKLTVLYGELLSGVP